MIMRMYEPLEEVYSKSTTSKLENNVEESLIPVFVSNPNYEEKIARSLGRNPVTSVVNTSNILDFLSYCAFLRGEDVNDYLNLSKNKDMSKHMMIGRINSIITTYIAFNSFLKEWIELEIMNTNDYSIEDHFLVEHAKTMVDVIKYTPLASTELWSNTLLQMYDAYSEYLSSVLLSYRLELSKLTDTNIINITRIGESENDVSILINNLIKSENNIVLYYLKEVDFEFIRRSEVQGMLYIKTGIISSPERSNNGQ